MNVSVDVATTTSKSEMNCHPQATELVYLNCKLLTYSIVIRFSCHATVVQCFIFACIPVQVLLLTLIGITVPVCAYSGE